MQGISSHHLLPCCAAMNPRTQESTAKTKLIGRCNGQNKGTKETPIRRRLAIPNFTDRAMPATLSGHPGARQGKAPQREARERFSFAYSPYAAPNRRCLGHVERIADGGCIVSADPVSSLAGDSKAGRLELSSSFLFCLRESKTVCSPLILSPSAKVYGARDGCLCKIDHVLSSIWGTL